MSTRRTLGTASPPRRCRRIAVILLVLAVIASSAPTQRLADYEVKAAYLFQFPRYVRWPAAADPSSPLTVCVNGDHRVRSTVAGIVEGETIAGRRVEIRRIAGPAQVSTCRILYLGSAEHDNIRAYITAARGPILTVSDAPGFLDQGGMIEFVSSGDRVRFAVNLEAAERAGLGISSELLKVAVSVKRKEQPGD